MGDGTPSLLIQRNRPACRTGAGRVHTCAERAVVLSSVLSHHADAVGGRLPDLGAGVAQGLQHPLDKVLGVLEGGRAAVLHYVVENAQTPLSVGPRPVGTLKPGWVSDGGGGGGG